MFHICVGISIDSDLVESSNVFLAALTHLNQHVAYRIAMGADPWSAVVKKKWFLEKYSPKNLLGFFWQTLLHVSYLWPAQMIFILAFSIRQESKLKNGYSKHKEGNRMSAHVRRFHSAERTCVKWHDLVLIWFLWAKHNRKKANIQPVNVHFIEPADLGIFIVYVWWETVDGRGALFNGSLSLRRGMSLCKNQNSGW